MKEWHGDDIDPEDVVLEEENDEPLEDGGAEKRVVKLKSELEACRAEKQEYMDGWQRAKADYVNLLKRGNEEVARAKQIGISKAVEEMFPAFDAIERAKWHGELPEGFLAIVKSLEDAFAKLGLEEIGIGTGVFDPVIHEALGQDSVDTAEKDGTITTVLEKGWKVGGMVIRPAKVRVARFASENRGA